MVKSRQRCLLFLLTLIMNKTAEKLTSMATVKKAKPLSAGEITAGQTLRAANKRMEQSTKLPAATEPV